MKLGDIVRINPEKEKEFCKHMSVASLNVYKSLAFSGTGRITLVTSKWVEIDGYYTVPVEILDIVKDS